MKKILVLDDNKDILNTLHLGLCACLQDCQILTASNGEKGVVILKNSPVDMIVTDLDMPVMNGYQFIEQVKRDHPDVPVCVMTGDCSSDDVVARMRALGVSRCIQKPFPFDKLAAMITEELHLVPQASLQ